MQKAISDKIQLGQTLNPRGDYGAIPSINDEGTLENLKGKVDKVTGFVATGKADYQDKGFIKILSKHFTYNKTITSCW